MKKFFRILIGAVLGTIAFPFAVALFILTSPYWIVGSLIAATEFVVSGEWEWPY